MRDAVADVGPETLHMLLTSRAVRPLVVLGPVPLTHPAGAAEVAAHLAALRSEPNGGWLLARGLAAFDAREYERIKGSAGRFLTAPRTLLAAVHEVADEIMALVYVDAAPRGFEVMAADGPPLFRAGDVFVRRAGRTERWTAADATRLVDRVTEQRRRAAEPPAPARAPRPPARPVVTAEVVEGLVAAAADVAAAYAAGALAVRLRRWDLVARTAAAQGPPDTIARAAELVRADEAYRPDGADDNAVLDSLCQLDAYAGLVAFDTTGTCEAGFARYWAQRARPAFRAVVMDADVRSAVFPGGDERLAAALRALDDTAAVEGSDSGGWPGIGDHEVEAFLARAPG